MQSIPFHFAHLTIVKQQAEHRFHYVRTWSHLFKMCWADWFARFSLFINK